MTRRWMPCAALLALAGCVADPAAPTTTPPTVPTGLFVLNEGLFGQNNARLDGLDLATGTVTTDLVGRATPGAKLGDTGNDLVAAGSSLYAVMNGSDAVVRLDRLTGALIGRIALPTGARSPRKLAIDRDSVAWVTSFADAVQRIDLRTGRLVGAPIGVGPAPEGVLALGNRLLVMNSGLGDLRRDEPGAWTVSVLDRHDGQLIETLRLGANPTEIALAPDGDVYAVCQGSYADPVAGRGAVIVLDSATLRVKARLDCGPHPTRVAFSPDGSGFVATTLAPDAGLVRFNWRRDVVTERPWFALKTVGGQSLYAIAVSPDGARLFVSRVIDYGTSAELLDLDPATAAIRSRTPVGLNPGALLFR